MLETHKAEDTQSGKNSEDDTIGNQQLTIAERAWLAGIIDGEGNLDLNRRYGQKRKGGGTWNWDRPRIVIGSTEAKMIEKISKIYKKVGIKFWYNIMKRQNENHKPCLLLITIGNDNVKSILEQVDMFLTTKKDQAKVLLDYCTWRIEAMKSSKKADWSKGSEYVEEYSEEMKRLKQDVPDVNELDCEPSTPLQIGSSETIREDFPWIGQSMI